MIQDTSGQDVALQSQGLKKQVKWLLGVAVLLSVGVAFAIPHYSEIISADKVVQMEELRTATVRRGDFVRKVISQGRVVAANSPTLFSAELGFIDLQVNAGDNVSEGQVLAVIISPELEEQLTRENAVYERIQIELKRHNIEAKRRKLELQQIQDLAGVTLVAMEREFRRAEKAFSFKIISELDYEQARDELDRARLKHRQAMQNNKLEQEVLDFAGETLSLQIKSQQVLLDSLQRQIDELTIRSPVRGMVGNVQVSQRQAVNPNQALITVVDLTAFEVEAAVPEGYANELAPLMSADVKFNDKYYPAELIAVSPEVVSGHVITRIRFKGEAPTNLRQNQRLTVRIHLENKSDVLLVDRGSFIDQFDGSVFKIVGNKAQRVPVVLGSRGLSEVEILDGLEVNDTIIVSSLQTDNDTESLLITN